MSNTPQERAFKGIWIPAEIWLATDLKVMEKLFLVEIDSLDNAFGCIASNAHFAQFFDLSISRTSEIINSLKAKKYIKIAIETKGKQVVKRTISVLKMPASTPSENTHTPFGKHEDPPSENTKGSNTLKPLVIHKDNTLVEESTEDDSDQQSPPPTTDKFTPEDTQLAWWIYQGVLNVLPKTKKPNLNKWADTIRLMRETDNLTRREIAVTFRWANRDEFWKTNICSPAKLRQQFATLDAKREQQANAENQPGTNSAGHKLSVVERVHEAAAKRERDRQARAGDGSAMGSTERDLWESTDQPIRSDDSGELGVTLEGSFTREH